MIGEQNVTATAFGTVSNKRVVFHTKKSLFGGRAQEDLPMRHITSVRVETVRHWIWGLLFGLLGLAMLAGPGGAKLLGLIVLAFALLLFWGWPKVVVNTAGGDLRPSVGLPWTRDEAERFVGALRQQLLARD